MPHDPRYRIPLRCAALCISAVCLAPPAMSQPRSPLPVSASTFDCLIKPSMTVHISPAIAGVVGSVHVDRGDIVKRGQPIAKLESQVEEVSVKLAQRRAENDSKIHSVKSRVEYLERKLARNRQLNTTKIVADQTIEDITSELKIATQEMVEAQVNVELAVLELERSKSMLQQRIVLSPIDGVITERNMVPGEYWNPEKPVATLVAIDPLHIETFAPLTLHGKVKVGHVATVRPEEPIGGEYQATVEVVDNVFDAASGTFGIRLRLTNPDYVLPAGIRCTVAFEIGKIEPLAAQSKPVK
jgi:RND family efflux transporter MFP subunit